MTREEIEQGFIDAGWEIDGGFSDHLIVGEDGDLSILAPRWVWEPMIPCLNCATGKGTSPTGYKRSRPPGKRRCYSTSTADRLKKSGATPTIS